MPMWEGHFYISPPHVPKPPNTGPLVEVVPDNVIACQGGVSSKPTIRRTDGYYSYTDLSRYYTGQMPRVGRDNIYLADLAKIFLT